jgi:hypothetical protein
MAAAVVALLTTTSSYCGNATFARRLQYGVRERERERERDGMREREMG